MNKISARKRPTSAFIVKEQPMYFGGACEKKWCAAHSEECRPDLLATTLAMSIDYDS